MKPLGRSKVLGLTSAGLFFMLGAGTASAQLVTEDLDTALTPTDLANSLAGPGVVVSNVSFTGANSAGGAFSGGTGIIGVESGVILSSGNIATVVGPNTVDGATTAHGNPGDADLDAISGFTTFDAAMLEFDITTNSSNIFIQYVFTSEEYNEYVNGVVNDSFGFFVNGTNCALVDGDPVSINTVNGGNPLGTNASNSGFYINNDLSDGGGSINTEMDGLTVVLVCEAAVNPGVANSIKLAIADAGDNILDSNVFIVGEGITTTNPQEEVPVPTLNPLGGLLLILVLATFGYVGIRRFA
jgi:hypothetical protein